MLYNVLEYVNVGNRSEVYSTQFFEYRNLRYIFFDWIISVIYGAEFTKFGTPVVEVISRKPCLRW